MSWGRRLGESCGALLIRIRGAALGCCLKQHLPIIKGFAISDAFGRSVVSNNTPIKSFDPWDFLS